MELGSRGLWPLGEEGGPPESREERVNRLRKKWTMSMVPLHQKEGPLSGKDVEREQEKPRLPGEIALIWALESENCKRRRQGAWTGQWMDRSEDPVKLTGTTWCFKNSENWGVLCKTWAPRGPWAFMVYTVRVVCHIAVDALGENSPKRNALAGDLELNPPHILAGWPEEATARALETQLPWVCKHPCSSSVTLQCCFIWK